ncbi:MAG: hypothetical protein SOY12_02130 [Schaedlerella sp.]|nr:hypothetical protein [Lachnospiraceae bacterium]MDY4201852.1 hypothetical protein [Schaedlerella sp.]
MQKRDIKDLLIGIILVVVGIFAIVYFNNEHVKYITAKEHYKVTATLISYETDVYYEGVSDGNTEKEERYLANWEYTAGGETYTVMTWEDSVPFPTKILRVYKDVNGEMIISSAGSTLSVLKWNVLGVIIIAGGVVYIVESVRRIRLRNKRLNGN